MTIMVNIGRITNTTFISRTVYSFYATNLFKREDEMPQPLSIRFEIELKAALKRIAQRRSYLTGRDYQWTDVLHEAAKKFIEEDERRQAEEYAARALKSPQGWPGK
jgi:hypothetical protein